MKDELNVYEYALGQGLQTYFNPMTNPAPIHPDILKQMKIMHFHCYISSVFSKMQ